MFLKFMHSADVDKFLGGSVLLGRLSYYRLLEMAFDDEFIGDRKEGISQWPEANHLASRTPATGTFDIQIDFKTLKMGMAGGAPHNLRSDEIDAFAFCVSRGELDPLWQTMCNPADQDSYDVAVEIFDLLSFSLHLYNLGQIRSPSGETKRVRDLFRGFGGQVVYRPNGQDQVNGSDILIPFSKRETYRDQAEWRIILVPKYDMGEQQLFVTLPDMEKFVRIIKRSPISERRQSNQVTSLEQQLDLLNDFANSGEFETQWQESETQKKLWRLLATVYIAAKKKGYAHKQFDMIVHGFVIYSIPILPVIARGLSRDCINFLSA